MTAPQRVLIMAGGTGGHVFPGLAAASAFRERGVDVAWLGSAAGIESRLVPQQQIDLMLINISGVRGQGMVRVLAAPFKIIKAVWSAMGSIRRWQPDMVLGMGGFVAGPGGVAAWLLRKPLFIHEQNAVPGLTNRLLARIARGVYQAFPAAFSGAKVHTIGNPIRTEIASLPAPEQRYAQRSGPLRILVLGGSQGAVALNKMVPGALHRLAQQVEIDIRHQAGERNLEAARDVYNALQQPAHVTAFIADMAAAYGWADLVICRAGALTVSELAGAGVAALLVPFPYAVDDHQTKNAGFLVDQGAAILVQQQTTDEQALAALLQTRLSDRQSLLTMAQAARKLAQPDATAALVEGCIRELSL